MTVARGQNRDGGGSAALTAAVALATVVYSSGRKEGY